MASEHPFSKLTRKEIVNGRIGSKSLKPLEMATSAGWPYNCAKRELATQDECGNWHFRADIWSGYEEFLNVLKSGKQPGYPVQCSNKMEVREQGKVCRKFQNAPLFLNMALKQYYGPVLAKILENSFISECAVGINPYGKDWNELHEFINQPYHVLHATDYSGFDQSIPVKVLEKLFVGYIEMASAMDYFPEDILIMKYIAAYVLRPLLLLDGDLFEMVNIMISGILGTSVLDGGVTSLLKRCFFFQEYPAENDFRSICKLMTFGDDALESRKWWYSKYSMVGYGKYVENLGMSLTPADKSGHLVRYISPKDMTFLKRSFRYSSDHKQIVGPLEQNSILKSLHAHVRSKYVSTEEVMIANLDRALVEFSLHGERDYTRFSAFVQTVPEKFRNSMKFKDFSYSDMVDAWKTSYLTSSTVVPDIKSGFFIEPGEVLMLEMADESPVTDDVGNMEIPTPDTVVDIPHAEPNIGERVDRDINLDEFFARPVKTVTLPISVGAGFSISSVSQPINDWAVNKRVVNRMSNYNLVRFDLVLDVVINTSQFAYGTFQVAYRPTLEGQDDSFPVPLNDYGAVLRSQWPSVYLDVGANSRATLKIPFVFGYEWYSVPRGDLISKYTGELVILNITPIRYASSPAPAFDIGDLSVFTHIENFQAKGITQFNAAGLVVQTGPVSKAMSTVARTADLAALVPGLGPAGAAISSVASGIGALAGMLGYTREPPTDGGHFMTPSSMGTVSVLDITDVVYKLSASQSQAISIGSIWTEEDMSDDPLSLSVIGTKFSFLRQFLWSDLTASGTRLTALYVDPMCPRIVNPSEPIPDIRSEYYYPAASIPAMFFEFWTGSMMYTFTPICSPFHKGRLAFLYDPEGSQESLEYNLGRIAILDLEEKQSITLMVDPAQQTPYLRVFAKTSDTQIATDSASGIQTNRGGYTNGMISVYVLSRLSSPNTTADLAPVNIRVDVAMCPNARYAAPSSYYTTFSPQDPYTGVVLESGTDVCHQMCNMNGSEPLDPNIDATYFGETILSLRALANRYILSSTTTIPYAGMQGNRNHTLQTPIYPMNRGLPFLNQYNGRIDPNQTPYCFTGTTVLQVVGWMFAGIAADIRHAFGVFIDTEYQYSFSVSRQELAGLDYERIDYATKPTDPEIGRVRATALGTTILTGGQTGTVSYVKVDFPFYSNWLMPCTRGRANSGAQYNTAHLQVTPVASYDNHAVTFEDYVAAPNIRVGMFLGLPRLFNHGNYPPYLSKPVVNL